MSTTMLGRAHDAHRGDGPKASAELSAPPARGRRIAPLALASIGLASVSLSLALRVAHRGPYYTGWDALGSAQGMLLIATKTPRELVRWHLVHHYDSGSNWNTYGLPHAVLPGWLTFHMPWEYWSSVTVFAFTLVSLALTGRAAGLEGREWTVLLLAFGASATLLSWSVVGFGYISATWPYAVALWTIHRWRRRWVATLLLSAFAIELSWHGQELGRTVFIVFIAAAFLIRRAPRATRTVWLTAGAWQLWDAWRHPTFNTARYSHVGFGADAGERLLKLGARVFLERYLDLPVLFVLGMAAVLVIRRERWFWRSLLAFHLALVITLALNSGILQGVEAIWPRRFLMVDYVCLAAVVALYQELRNQRLAAGALVALLLAGNAWQLIDTWRWSRQPFDHVGSGASFTLPFTHSTLDYTVPVAAVDWAHEVQEDVQRGKTVILIYNLSSYEENATNPAGLPERLYLALGHRRFVRAVLMFGSQNGRWNEFPVLPMRSVDPVLDGITDPREVVGYYRTHPFDGPLFKQESSAVLEALARRWDVVWEPEVASAGARFRLHLETRIDS